MAFFDNWRVQLAMLRVLDEDMEKTLVTKEHEYTQGDTATQEAIFLEYQYCVKICQNALIHVMNNRKPATGLDPK